MYWAFYHSKYFTFHIQIKSVYKGFNVYWVLIAASNELVIRDLFSEKSH